MFERVRRWIWESHYDVDHYELRHRQEGERGWSRIEGDTFEGWSPRQEAPAPAEQVRKHARDHTWPSGHYRLLAITSEGDFGATVWTIEVEDTGWEQKRRRREEIEELRRTVERLQEALADGDLGGREVEEIDDAFGVTAGKILDDGADSEQVQRLVDISQRWAESQRQFP